MKRLRLIPLLVSLLAVSCFSRSCFDQYSGRVVSLDELYEAELVTNATDRIEIEGCVLVLGEVWLSRDFMPVSAPPGGTTLRGWVDILSEGGSIPADVDVEKVYVINADRVWVVHPQLEQASSNEITLRPDGGPKWGPDIAVDVAIALFDTSNNRYFLGQDEVWIHLTE